MFGERIVKPDRHRRGTTSIAARRVRRRRALALAAVCAALIFVLAVLWLLPLELPAGPLGLTKLRIRYGLFGWHIIDTGGVERPPSRPWPWSLGWARSTRGWSLLATVTASALAVLMAVWSAQRLDRRLAPRTHCRNCGQRLRGGFGDSPVCPECGELPYARW